MNELITSATINVILWTLCNSKVVPLITGEKN